MEKTITNSGTESETSRIIRRPLRGLSSTRHGGVHQVEGSQMRDFNRRVTLRVAMALTVPTVLIAGADAANAATYDLYGKVPKSGAGAASASGSVTFASAYKFNWKGSIRDICPADGKGAELQIVVRHTDGTQTVRANVLQDLDGCGATAISGSGSVTDPKRIKNVMVVLYSTEGGDPWVTLDLSPDKDNPYT